MTGADHWVAAAFLCADKPKKTAGADVYNGTTIDQIIAKKIGTESLIPSLQLAVEDPGANSSNCGEGYSCTYTNTISWASPTSPLPMELNPQVVFERMFGDGSTAEERAARRKRDGSILDSLTGSLSRMRTRVSAADRERLDDYTTNVREIERRLQIAMKASTVAPEDISVPVGCRSPSTSTSRCSSICSRWRSRPTSRASARCSSPATSPAGRIRRVRRRRPASTACRTTARTRGKSTCSRRSTRYHVKMLAHLIDNLAKKQDGDGTLLDQSLVLFGSNMGNSNQHVHYDVPHVLVGGANGKLKGGRHLAYPTKIPTRQPAPERARQVRHSPGQDRRQHRPAGGAVRTPNT